MDEEVIETEVVSVGERLRAAREAQKLSLEDVADRTRIPLRHLESLETSDWENLPAATYTVGFAKSYAGVVGLDRAEISDAIRAELGAPRYVSSTQSEAFEPADPKRSMPRGLVFGALGAIAVLLLLFWWLSNRSLDSGAEDVQVPENAVVAAPPPTAQAPVASGPVVITATEPVWLRVYNSAGKSYFAGILSPSQPFTVPDDAVAPLIAIDKPEAITISVGGQPVASLAPAGTGVLDRSLRPADLLAAPAAPVTAAPPPVTQTPAPAPVQRRRPARRAATPSAPAAAPSEPAATEQPAPAPAQPTGN